MLGSALALTLAVGPEPAGPAASTEPELPDYRSAPEVPPEAQPLPKQAPPVPNTGAGMLSLGSMMLVTGVALAVSSTAIQLSAEEPYGTALGGLFSIPLTAGGAVLVALGAVTRKKHRKRAATQPPDTPPTGSGMLLGGLGLMVGGTASVIPAAVDMSSEICSGLGCQDIRPIGAPLQLGLSIAAATTGVVLTSVGIRRRIAYKRWAWQQTLRPSLALSRTRLTLGVTGRF